MIGLLTNNYSYKARKPSAMAHFHVRPRNWSGGKEESHENLNQNCQTLSIDLNYEIPVCVKNVVVNDVAPWTRRYGVSEVIDML